MTFTGVSDYSATQVTGVTQALLRPALEAMNDLFGYFDLLVKTVDKATQLHASINTTVFAITTETSRN